MPKGDERTSSRNARSDPGISSTVAGVGGTGRPLLSVIRVQMITSLNRVFSPAVSQNAGTVHLRYRAPVLCSRSSTKPSDIFNLRSLFAAALHDAGCRRRDSLGRDVADGVGPELHQATFRHHRSAPAPLRDRQRDPPSRAGLRLPSIAWHCAAPVLRTLEGRAAHAVL